MPARFHEAALSALGVSYASDPEAVGALEVRSAQLGVRFPAAFVEWYGMRDGLALLQEHSNSDWPVPIAELGEPPHPQILRFMIENQSVAWWGIALDAGDDPPVLVAVDPDFAWRAHAPSFSTFIACQIWDHANSSERPMLGAQASPLAAADLGRLRRTFREGPTTHGWPARDIYRFERDDAHILIWDADGQADWWISAGSEDALTAVAREVWTCGDLSTSLYGTDERGEHVVRMLRSR